MEVTVNGRRLFYALSVLLFLGIGITIAGDGVQPQYTPSEKAYYLTDAQASWIRPGLKLQIQKVEFEPPNVSVTFRIADNANQGLDRLGIQTPGAVTVGVVLARIKPGDSQYTSYFTNPATSPITGATANQPAADSGGTYTSLGDGAYKYTLGR